MQQFFNLFQNRIVENLVAFQSYKYYRCHQNVILEYFSNALSENTILLGGRYYEYD